MSKTSNQSKQPKITFNIEPAPTFKGVAEIPFPGGGSAPMAFTFKHRRSDEVNGIMARAAHTTADTMTQAKYLMDEIVVSWHGAQRMNDGKLEDIEFTQEEFAEFLAKWPGASYEIFHAWAQQLAGAKLGNW